MNSNKHYKLKLNGFLVSDVLMDSFTEQLFGCKSGWFDGVINELG